MLEKRGRGPAGPLQTHQFCRPPQLSFSTARKKGFPPHYRVSFVQPVVEGMSMYSGLCRSCSGLHAGLLYCSRIVYLLGDLHKL